MLNRRVQSVKEGLPPTRMKALCATLRDEGLHLYIVVFLAQIAPVVVYAMNIDPSGKKAATNSLVRIPLTLKVHRFIAAGTYAMIRLILRLSNSRET